MTEEGSLSFFAFIFNSFFSKTVGQEFRLSRAGYEIFRFEEFIR